MLQAGVAAAPGGVLEKLVCVSLALPLQDVQHNLEPKHCNEILVRGPHSTDVPATPNTAGRAAQPASQEPRKVALLPDGSANSTAVCLLPLSLQDVQRNLEPKNRDKFTQNLTIVRHEFKSKV